MLKFVVPIILMFAITGPTKMPEWLVGTWECKTTNATTIETWTMDGQTLRGSSRTLKDGKVVFTETLQIKRNDKGKLVYIAEPMGQVETVFTEVESKDGFVAFENPDHDFPKRITYKLMDDTLVAEISGDGNSMSWTFTKSGWDESEE